MGTYVIFYSITGRSYG